jgi:outer membrane protein TolC
MCLGVTRLDSAGPTRISGAATPPAFYCMKTEKLYQFICAASHLAGWRVPSKQRALVASASLMALVALGTRAMSAPTAPAEPARASEAFELTAPSAPQPGGLTQGRVGNDGLPLNRIVAEAIAVGFEARLASIAVDAARGDAKSFAAIANPAVSLGYGRALGYNPAVCSSPGCSPNQYTVGLSDQAAIADVVSGKRGLRKDIGQLSVRIAGLQRDDAIRVIKLAAKQQFSALVFAQARLRLAQRVLQKTQETEQLVQARFNAGAPLPDLLRAQAIVLDAQSRLRAAQIQLASDRAQLAVMIGRANAEALIVEESLLVADPPPAVELTPPVAHWVEQAQMVRPDRAAAGAAVDQSEASLRLARRNRWPDIELQLGYTQQGLGSNAIQPGTVSATITAPIPLVYQNQGQIERALADEAARSTERRRLDVQIASAVRTSLANAGAAWTQVQHTQQRLERARRAVDMVRLQYQEGATSLVDLLEATNSAIDAEQDCLAVRQAMWNQVFQLEYDSGKELVK